MSRLLRFAPALVLMVAACTVDSVTDAPIILEAAFDIEDGAHNGVGGFFWLTPTVKKSQKSFSGTFDAGLLGDVFIDVCRINGTAPETPDDCTAIRTFSAASQPEIIRVDLDAQNYSVTWQSTGTNGTDVVVGDHLRAFAHVMLPAGGHRTLGFVDMIGVASQREVRGVTAGYSGFVVGSPFVFKFRVETGIAGSIVVEPAGQMIFDGTVGETADYTATVTDLHSSPMVGVTVAWTSDQPAVADVSPPAAATDGSGVSATTASSVGKVAVATPTDVEIGASFQDLSDSEVLIVKPNPENPALDIEKATNGLDADDPNAGDAPQIAPGDVVTWTYLVTNTGDVALSSVVVTDDQGLAVSCPQTTLAVGGSMICSASGLADNLASTGFTTVPGMCGAVPNTPLYENIGQASAISAIGTIVQDSDPSHYCNPPENPALDIEKATNGLDADDPNAGDAPQIAPGDVVTWTYLVTNTGDVALSSVVVTDDQGLAVSCPQTTLAVGGSMICSASGLADNLASTGFTTVPGMCGAVPNTPLYENIGQASAISAIGTIVQDSDPSHYCNPPENPALDIEKATNGLDADDPNAGDAPQIAPGDVVTWTYLVTNTGDVALSSVVVTDDQGLAVSCPQTTLAVGGSMICSASGLADNLASTGFTTVPGMCGAVPNTPLYENIGQASAISAIGTIVQDSDPSHYCNPPENPALDIEKATNGLDADDPNAGDAPQIAPGDVVTWTYLVTNTGDVALSSVVVTDDQGLAVSCPQTTLAVGGSMICSASGLADNLASTGFTTVPGMCGAVPNTPLYENIGQASAISAIGTIVQDSDPSHYCNPSPGD